MKLLLEIAHQVEDTAAYEWKKKTWLHGYSRHIAFTQMHWILKVFDAFSICHILSLDENCDNTHTHPIATRRKLEQFHFRFWLICLFVRLSSTSYLFFSLSFSHALPPLAILRFVLLVSLCAFAIKSTNFSIERAIDKIVCQCKKANIITTRNRFFHSWFGKGHETFWRWRSALISFWRMHFVRSNCSFNCHFVIQHFPCIFRAVHCFAIDKALVNRCCHSFASNFSTQTF